MNIIFSLGDDKLDFNIDNQHFESSQGLSQIASQIIKYKIINALALENIIYIAEEILESFKLDYHVSRRAETPDQYMHILSDLFFDGRNTISRHELEHAFNEFVERIEYYVQQLNDNIYPLIYFVFVREMMHHLNVDEIRVT